MGREIRIGTEHVITPDFSIFISHVLITFETTWLTVTERRKRSEVQYLSRIMNDKACVFEGYLHVHTEDSIKTIQDGRTFGSITQNIHYIYKHDEHTGRKVIGR